MSRDLLLEEDEEEGSVGALSVAREDVGVSRAGVIVDRHVDVREIAPILIPRKLKNEPKQPTKSLT